MFVDGLLVPVLTIYALHLPGYLFRFPRLGSKLPSDNPLGVPLNLPDTILEITLQQGRKSTTSFELFCESCSESGQVKFISNCTLNYGERIRDSYNILSQICWTQLCYRAGFLSRTSACFHAVQHMSSPCYTKGSIMGPFSIHLQNEAKKYCFINCSCGCYYLPRKKCEYLPP